MPELHCYNSKCNKPISSQDTVCPHCGSRLVLHNQYRIVGVLGQGGFGYVYDAIEFNLQDRRCAIKEVWERPPSLSRQQIEQEVMVLARISGRFHFIPDIYSRWSEEQRHYIVMQYVPGKTIEKVRALPWSPNEVTDFVRALLGYLEQLHAAEVVHRDIKPFNIKYTSERGYVLLDFGLATHRSDTIIQARSPDFAPPEQFHELRTSDDRTDPRSDLYSLAATAYYLLTGAPPTRADLRKKGQRLDPPKHREEIPAALERAVMFMLAFNIDERPANAHQALKLLNDDRTTVKFWTEPTVYDNTTTPIDSSDSIRNISATVQKFCQGKGCINRIAWSPDSMHLAIASAVGVYTFTPSTQEEHSFQRQPAPVQHIAYALNGDALVYALHNDIQLWQIQPQHYPRSITAPATGDEEFAGFVCDRQGQLLAVASDKGVALIEPARDRHIATIPVEVRRNGMALTPNGAQLALATSAGIEIWQIRNGTPTWHRTLPAPSQVVNLAFAQDGRVLMVASPTTVTVVGINQGQPRYTITSEAEPIVDAALTADGKTLAVATSHEVRVWQIAGHKRLWTLSDGLHDLRQIAFSPNGELLVGTSNDEGWVWQTNSGALIAPIEDHLDSIRSLAISPDGRLLASMGGRVRLWEVQEAALAQRSMLEGQSSDHNGVAFDPSGQMLASASSEGVRVWHVADERLLADWDNSEAAQVHSVAFTDNGQTLINVGTQAIQRWDVADGSVQTILDEQLAEEEYGVVLTPNGEWLVTFAHQSAQVWRSDGTLYQRVTTSIDIDSVALTPDGRLLAVASSEATQVWELERKPKQRANLQIGATRMVFSPNGDMLALLYDTTLYRWRWKEPNAARAPNSHTQTVTDAVFLPQGGALISASDDGTLWLWRWEESAAVGGSEGGRS